MEYRGSATQQNDLTRAIQLDIKRERDKVNGVKEAVRALLNELEPHDSSTDVRRLMLDRFGVLPVDTMAALRELSHDGVIYLDDEYVYHLVTAQV